MADLFKRVSFFSFNRRFLHLFLWFLPLPALLLCLLLPLQFFCFFFITLSLQLVICLAEGQTGCCTLQDCRQLLWCATGTTWIEWTLSWVSPLSTLTKLLRRLNVWNQLQRQRVRICWFHEARFKECFFIYIRIWDQQKQNCQTSLFLVIK